MIILSSNWNYDFSVKNVHVPPDKPYIISYQLDIEWMNNQGSHNLPIGATNYNVTCEWYILLRKKNNEIRRVLMSVVLLCVHFQPFSWYWSTNKFEPI